MASKPQSEPDKEVTGTVKHCTPCDTAHSGPINHFCQLAGPEAIAQFILANNLISHVANLDDLSDSELTSAQPQVTTVAPSSGQADSITATTTTDVNKQPPLNFTATVDTNTMSRSITVNDVRQLFECTTAPPMNPPVHVVTTITPPMNPPVHVLVNKETPSQLKFSQTAPKKGTVYKIVNSKGQTIGTHTGSMTVVRQANPPATTKHAIVHRIVPTTTTAANFKPGQHNFSFMRRDLPPQVQMTTATILTTAMSTTPYYQAPHPAPANQIKPQLSDIPLAQTPTPPRAETPPTLVPNPDCRQRNPEQQQPKEILSCATPIGPPQLAFSDIPKFRDSNLALEDAQRIVDIIAAQHSFDSLKTDTQYQPLYYDDPTSQTDNIISVAPPVVTTARPQQTPLTAPPPYNMLPHFYPPAATLQALNTTARPQPTPVPQAATSTLTPRARPQQAARQQHNFYRLPSHSQPPPLTLQDVMQRLHTLTLQQQLQASVHDRTADTTVNPPMPPDHTNEPPSQPPLPTVEPQPPVSAPDQASQHPFNHEQLPYAQQALSQEQVAAMLEATRANILRDYQQQLDQTFGANRTSDSATQNKSTTAQTENQEAKQSNQDAKQKKRKHQLTSSSSSSGHNRTRRPLGMSSTAAMVTRDITATTLRHHPAPPPPIAATVPASRTRKSQAPLGNIPTT